ncbi:MAG: hypothetical protein M0C28_00440 [Candidatus Moduliflexus flocculans]|nr:hypothetical protein [Candidatus Moduliflexus flocculans]
MAGREPSHPWSLFSGGPRVPVYNTGGWLQKDPTDKSTFSGIELFIYETGKPIRSVQDQLGLELHGRIPTGESRYNRRDSWRNFVAGIVLTVLTILAIPVILVCAFLGLRGRVPRLTAGG